MTNFCHVLNWLSIFCHICIDKSVTYDKICHVLNLLSIFNSDTCRKRDSLLLTNVTFYDIIDIDNESRYTHV